MKVCVLGLGEVGLPTAKYILEKGLEVWGYDINPITTKKAIEEGILMATSNWDKVPPLDTYIICVSTTLKGSIPDLSAIFDVCEKISQKARSSSLVCIESTVVPGISKKIYEGIFKKSVNLIHTPHRYWPGDPVRHGVKQPRVIGAINAESLNKGLEFYRELLGVPLHIASSIEVAEMCKIAENSYRYVQIAFAEELAMICREVNLDFDEVRKACNSKWNVEMLEARDGIGGHCLPKDIKYLASLTTDNNLLKAASNVDKMYRKWLSRKRKIDDRLDLR